MQNTGFSWLTDVAEESFKNCDPFMNGGISLAVETSIKNKWNKKYQSTSYCSKYPFVFKQACAVCQVEEEMYFFAWLVVKKTCIQKILC